MRNILKVSRNIIISSRFLKLYNKRRHIFLQIFMLWVQIFSHYLLWMNFEVLIFAKCSFLFHRKCIFTGIELCSTCIFKIPRLPNLLFHLNLPQKSTVFLLPDSQSIQKNQKKLNTFQINLLCFLVICCDFWETFKYHPDATVYVSLSGTV